MRASTASCSGRSASATPGWPTSRSACTSRRRSRPATATAGTPRGRRSPTASPPKPMPRTQAGHVDERGELRLRATEYYRQAFFWHRDDLAGTELTTATGRASPPSEPRSATYRGPVGWSRATPPATCSHPPATARSHDPARRRLRRHRRGAVHRGVPRTRPGLGDRRLDGPVPAPCSTTATCRCDPIGSTSCPACSTSSPPNPRSTPVASCSSADRSAGCSPHVVRRASRDSARWSSTRPVRHGARHGVPPRGPVEARRRPGGQGRSSTRCSTSRRCGRSSGHAW